MTGLFRAVALLTILPCHRHTGDGDWGRATPFFPAAGALVGLALAGLDLAAAGVLPPPVRAALVLVAGAVITGGLHLDGLADTLDGLGSKAGRDRALEIMRDSRVGATGAAGLVLSQLLKFALLTSLEGPWRPLAIFLLPAAGRLAMVPAVALYPYARSGPGLGRSFSRRVGWRGMALSLAATILLALLVAAWWGSGPGGLSPGEAWQSGLAFTGSGLAGALLAGGLLARYAAGRLGGLTGDVYGAVNEAAELAWLLCSLLAGAAAGVMPGSAVGVMPGGSGG